MAGKKRATSRKTVARRKTVRSRPSKASVSLYDYFRFGESYTSLVLGIVVVIIVTILLVAFVRNRQATLTKQNTQETSSISTTENTLEKLNDTQVIDGKNIYTVKPGDDLWKIAQEQYKDGYKWVQIAQANNISTPGVIHAGTKLTLPQTSQVVGETTIAKGETVTSESPAQMESTAPKTPEIAGKITANKYTVVRGDDLWNIAIRAYGDGYKWVDIAKANNLTNPNVIHSNNVLTIPR